MAAHPGFSATSLTSHSGNAVTNLFMGIGSKLLAQSDDQGALPTLYASTEDLPGGSYVGPDGFQEARGHPRLVGRSAAASDADVAARLWALSEGLTGTTFPAAAGPRRTG